jgi:hypothetical protein
MKLVYDLGSVLYKANHGPKQKPRTLTWDIPVEPRSQLRAGCCIKLRPGDTVGWLNGQIKDCLQTLVHGKLMILSLSERF